LKRETDRAQRKVVTVSEEEAELSFDAYVGVDVSKKSLDVHVLPGGAEWTFDNNEDGRSNLRSKIDQFRRPLVVLEPTGGYERNLVELLVEAKVATAVVNAKQVRDFASAIGQLAKTDRIDARCLALFAERVRPVVRPMADPESRELLELMTRRRQLVSMRAAEQVRRHEARGRVKESVGTLITTLTAEINAIEQEIADRIEKSPLWHARDELLQTAKGVGNIVSRTLIAAMPELGRISGKQAAALAGLAPFNRDSGQRNGKRRIRGGRYEIRMLMVLAARTAVRFDATMQAFYERLLQAGKSKMVALIACARKLLVRLNAMARENTPWNPPNQRLSA
jgi:transposase